MRLVSVGLVLGLLSAVLGADVVRDEDDIDIESSELIITAHFPDTNPFHHVVNGQTNNLYLIIDNKSEVNATLKSVSGSLHHPQTQALVKNLTTMPTPVLSVAGTKFSIPYAFHSELKPGDYDLHIWVDRSLDGTTFERATAYEGKITVVEPEASFFDIKMIITYLITGGVLAAGGYFAVLSFVPTLVKPKKKRVVKENISAPSATSVTTSSGATYQEEWIPEHHLKSTARRGGKKAEGALSSGDEKSPSSGGEDGAATSRKSKRGKKA